ncbi:hypothetical protein [Spirosoma areae]
MNTQRLNQYSLKSHSQVIAIVCFLAPAVWINLWLACMVSVYRLIEFTPAKITYWTLFGCLPQTWMQPVTFFANQFITALFAGCGYWLLNGKEQPKYSFAKLTASAALLYPIADRCILIVLHLINQWNPLWFINRKAYAEQRAVPVFGNLYVFQWFSFCIDWISLLLLCALAYRVVFYYWPPAFRKHIFTAGAMAGSLGWLFWYLWLGPILY